MVGMLNDSFAYKYSAQLYCGWCEAWKVDFKYSLKAQASKWFMMVDKKPNIYMAYYNDPENSKAFKEFKADNSNHLKLLYCIDMLNEGVHVDDIDGVILLRPTVSPIIYMQQIGRCLAAGDLTADKIEKLNLIGMVWNVNGGKFSRAYEELKLYHDTYGNLDIKARYVSPSGFCLVNGLIISGILLRSMA